MFVFVLVTSFPPTPSLRKLKAKLFSLCEVKPNHFISHSIMYTDTHGVMWKIFWNQRIPLGQNIPISFSIKHMHCPLPTLYNINWLLLVKKNLASKQRFWVQILVRKWVAQSLYNNVGCSAMFKTSFALNPVTLFPGVYKEPTFPFPSFPSLFPPFLHAEWMSPLIYLDALTVQ